MPITQPNKQDRQISESDYTVETFYPSDIAWETERSETVDTITEEAAAGYAVEIVYDTIAENPRDQWTLGTLIGAGTLSDEDVPSISDNKDLVVYIARQLDKTVPDRYDLAAEADEEGVDKETIWARFEDDVLSQVFILPVYKYQHSGVAFKTTPFRSTWDSGQAGFIFVTKDRAKEELSGFNEEFSLKERVRKILKSEVETYSSWANGDIYGWRIYNLSEGIIEDSCYGYYDIDYCKASAFDILTHHTNDE